MRKTVITITDDGSGPDHAAVYDVSVVEDGKEVECGELPARPRSSRWLDLMLLYLDHRLCACCPGSTAAPRPASSSRANQPAAYKESAAAPGRAKRRYPA
jgi:hypothetical protein